MSVPPVIPPFRFATVEAGRVVAGRSAEECGAESLYRSAYPSLRNYRFLLGLNLQTIISLVPSSEPIKDLAEFCEMNLITHRHFQVPRFRGLRTSLLHMLSAALPNLIPCCTNTLPPTCSDEVTLTSALTSQLLGELVDMDRYPILIHCVDGARN